MQMKVCSKCKRELPATTTYFYKNISNKDGFQYYCKVCCGGNYSKVVKEGYKICSKCKEELPLPCFSLNRRRPSGYRSCCKKCDAKAREQFKSKTGIPSTTMYRKLNYEKVSMQNKIWKANNKERDKANINRWLINNKQKYLEMERLKVHKRNALKKKLISSLTKKDWEECLKFFNYTDAYTGLSMQNPSQDHIIPLSKGGNYIKQNIVPCEMSINSSKRNNDMETWYRQQPFFSEERLAKIYKWMGVKDNIQQLKII